MDCLPLTASFVSLIIVSEMTAGGNQNQPGNSGRPASDVFLPVCDNIRIFLRT